MLMHHVAAFNLLICMCFGNGLAFGCTVAFLHDIADVPASVTKLFAQTDYTMMAVITFLINMVVWGYTRNYLLLKYVHFLWTSLIYALPKPYDQFYWVYYGAAILLTGMLILQYYWYVLFIKILLFYKKTGKAEDLQNDSRKNVKTKN